MGWEEGSQVGTSRSVFPSHVTVLLRKLMVIQKWKKFAGVKIVRLNDLILYWVPGILLSAMNYLDKNPAFMGTLEGTIIKKIEKIIQEDRLFFEGWWSYL